MKPRPWHRWAVCAVTTTLQSGRRTHVVELTVSRRAAVRARAKAETFPALAPTMYVVLPVGPARQEEARRG